MPTENSKRFICEIHIASQNRGVGKLSLFRTRKRKGETVQRFGAHIRAQTSGGTFHKRHSFGPFDTVFEVLSSALLFWHSNPRAK